MATIPTYERRREIGAPARPTTLSSSAAAAPMQALAQGAAQIGGQVTNLIQTQRKEDEAKLEDSNALAASTALSQGEELWNRRQTELQQNWKVGDPDISETLNKEFEAWKGEQRATLGTEKSRNWFDGNAERMRSRIGQSTYNWQEKTRQDVESQQFKAGVDADLKVLSEHPEMYDEVMARRLTAVGAMQRMPESNRIAIGEAFKKEAAKAVEYGKMLRDPQKFLDENTVKPAKPDSGAVVSAGALPPPGSTAPMARTQDPVSTAIPAEGRAFLNVIASHESGGRYNVRYTPKGGAEFDPTGQHPGIAEPTADGKTSTAAGRYQFTKTTWNRLTGGKVPFTPENQDKFAWQLAQQDYKARTGRDLHADLKEGGATPAVRAALEETWHGLKNGKGAEKIYAETLARSQGAAPLSSSDSAGTHISPTASPTFQAMDLHEQQQMIDEANRRLRQQESQLRSQADRILVDASAMHKDGRVDPFNLGPDYFQKAYGADDGAIAYQNYAAGRSMANDIAAFATQSPDQIQATLAAADPLAGQGYAAADARKNIRVQAAGQVLELRAKDPMQFAMKNGMTQAQPLDMAKPQEIGPELNRRVGTASMMATKYGTGLRPLTNQEAATMGATLRALPPEAKLGYLEQVRLGLMGNPSMFHAVMAQIAPDSPVTSEAGSILVKQGTITMPGGMFGTDTVLQPRQVAATVLEGEAILNPTKQDKQQDGRGGKFPMPKETDLQTYFNDQAGSAFRGNDAAYANAYQAFKAYYAGKSSREGVLSEVMDDKRAREAFTAVTGGVIDYNGNGNVRKPWGMPDAEFKDQAAAQWSETMTARGYKPGEYEDLSSYGLMGVREGVYLVTSGNSALRDRQGNLVELRIQPLVGPMPLSSVGRPGYRSPKQQDETKKAVAAPFSLGF